MKNVLIIDNSKQINPVLQDTEVQLLSSNDEVQALNLLESSKPAVVLLHYDMRGAETVDYIKLIHDESSGSEVIIIANELSEENVIKCLMAGAKGYQELNQLDLYVDKLIKVVVAGEAWITRRLVSQLLNRLRSEQ